MYTYDYDFSFSPSMPIVEVALNKIQQNGEPRHLTAMIDSGADGSLIPLSDLRAIKAHRVGQVILRSITGTPTVVDVYEVALQIGPHHFPYVRVAADKHNKLYRNQFETRSFYSSRKGSQLASLPRLDLTPSWKMRVSKTTGLILNSV